MCNAKVLGIAALAAVGVATGGFGLLGAGAAAGAAGGATAAAGLSAGTAAAAAGTGAAAAGGLTTLQTGALIASAAGTGLSVYGQYQAGRAQQAAARYNQQVAAIEAQDALDRGDREQQRVGIKEAQMRGEQRVRMAANGLDLSYGTPEALLEQTDYYGLEDQRTVANNARREAAGFGQRSVLAGLQADSANPWGNAAGSLLVGASSVADKWMRYRGG